MGMYTDFMFRAKLRDDTPDDILADLNGMSGIAGYVNGTFRWQTYTPISDHPLFQTTRWEDVIHGSEVEDGVLWGSSNFKNYDDEVGKFLDWIRPYVDEHPDKVIGIEVYEGSDWPTFYTKAGVRDI